MNLESFLPIKFKKGLIYTLLFSYFNLCLSYFTFRNKLQKFKSFLKQNGYPDQIVDHHFRTFLNKVFQHQSLHRQPQYPKSKSSRKIDLACLFIDSTTCCVSTSLPHKRFFFSSRANRHQKCDLMLLINSRANTAKCHVDETCQLLHTRISEQMGILAYTSKAV